MDKFIKILIPVVVIAGLFYLVYFLLPSIKQVRLPNPIVTSEKFAVKKFSSEQEFNNYLKESRSVNSNYSSNLSRSASPQMAIDTAMPSSVSKESSTASFGMGAERSSETNVQVAGIDEPDILKTNGKEIYYSQEENYYWSKPLLETVPNYLGMPIRPTGETKVFKAYPASELASLAKISQNGELLLDKNRLIVFENDKILGYDIANPSKPEKSWEYAYTERSSKTAARFYNGKLFLVTQTGLGENGSCDFTPFNGLSVRCTDIYYPTNPTATDTTYHVMIISPEDGKIQKSVSFLGSNSSTTVYMSKNNLYLAYYVPANRFDLMYKFYQEASILPQTELDRLKKLTTYDLSYNAKMAELEDVTQNYFSSLPQKERESKYELQNKKMQDFFKAHNREIGKTGFTRIDLNKLSVEATGSVPGKLLNQFSLDEFENNLRAAMTVGGDWWFGGQETNANDVYVLNKDLKEIGSVKDLGLKERIYSARFMGDRGYLVTFRQTDPFYVLDLSSPTKPQVKGELKIPGFSSYLHEVANHRILGIGREEGKVKLSLFDVTEPQSPKEISKMYLSSYWTEASDDPHAFLLDSKHGVFFLPSDNGGHIISFKNNELKEEKKLDGYSVKRAMYIDDNLYILSSTGIVVIDENTWQEIKKLEF